MKPTIRAVTAVRPGVNMVTGLDLPATATANGALCRVEATRSADQVVSIVLLAKIAPQAKVDTPVAKAAIPGGVRGGMTTRALRAAGMDTTSGLLVKTLRANMILIGVNQASASPTPANLTTVNLTTVNQVNLATARPDTGNLTTVNQVNLATARPDTANLTTANQVNLATVNLNLVNLGLVGWAMVRRITINRFTASRATTSRPRGNPVTTGSLTMA